MAIGSVSGDSEQSGVAFAEFEEVLNPPAPLVEGVELPDSGLFFAEVSNEDHPVLQSQSFFAKIGFLSFGLLAKVASSLVGDLLRDAKNDESGGKFIPGSEQDIEGENSADFRGVLAGGMEKVFLVSLKIHDGCFRSETTESEGSFGGGDFKTPKAAVGQITDQEVSCLKELGKETQSGFIIAAGIGIENGLKPATSQQVESELEFGLGSLTGGLIGRPREVPGKGGMEGNRAGISDENSQNSRESFGGQQGD